MSVSIKVDGNNNIIIIGNLSIVNNKESLIQDIKNRINMSIEEYPYNITKGINYLHYLQNGDKSGLLYAMKESIMQDKRVKNVDFEESKKGNNLKIILRIDNNETVEIEI